MKTIISSLLMISVVFVGIALGGLTVEQIKLKAESGDAQAQDNLGACYEYGDGVEKDFVEGVKWFRKSAEQGVARAQFNLGVCYGKGGGVEKNFVEAYKWFLIAGAKGNDKAGDEKRRIEKEMTPTQIEAAKQAAKDFAAKTHALEAGL